MSVKRDIYLKIEKLRGLSFNWDLCDGLSMRGDVREYAEMLFGRWSTGGLDPELLDAAGMPELILFRDGTLDIIFTRTRTLVFTLYSDGVTGFRKEFEDKQTEIEGLIRPLSPRHSGAPKEFTELLTWLVQE